MGWRQTMYGDPPAEPDAATETAPSWDPPSATKVRPAQPRTMRNDVFLGYIMAAIAPTVGILVGVALIAKDEPSGPSVVGWSVGSMVIWAIVAGLVYGLVIAA